MQLKPCRLKFRIAQFLVKVADDHPHLGKRTAEQVLRPRGFPKLGKLRFRIKLHPLVRDCQHLATGYRAEAPAPLYLPPDVLQHVMNEGAVNRRIQLRRLPLAGIESVIQEIGKAALGKLVNARRGQVQRLIVERTHRRLRKRAEIIFARLGKLPCRPRKIGQTVGRLPPQIRRRGKIRQILPRAARGQRVGIGADRRRRKQSPCAAQEIRSILRCAEIKPFASGRQHAVDRRQLQRQQPCAGRVHADARLGQIGAFAVGQEGLVSARRGKHTLIRTEEEQHLRIAAALGHQAADIHAIKACRYRADGVAAQRRAENSGEFIGVMHRDAQNAVKLLQNAADHTVNLRVFLRLLQLPRRVECLGTGRQAFPQPDLLQKVVQRQRHLGGIFRSAQCRPQMQQRRNERSTVGVQSVEQRLSRLIRPFSIAVGRHIPFPCPCFAADRPQQGIVFQPIRSRLRQRQITRLQHGKHRLCFQGLRCLQRRKQHMYDRLAHDVAVAGKISGDLRSIKHGAQQRQIRRIGTGDRYIPPTQPLLDKPKNLTCGNATFRFAIRCRQERQIALRHLECLVPAAEQMLPQKALRRLLLGAKAFNPRLNAQSCRDTEQPLRRLSCRLKLLPAVLRSVAEKRDRHLRLGGKELGDDLLLNAVEIRKAVKPKALTRSVVRFLKRRKKAVELCLRILPQIGGNRVIALHQEGKFLGFQREHTAELCGNAAKGLRRDAKTAKFVERIDQLQEKFRLIGAVGIDFQTRTDLIDRKRHHQQLAALVRLRLRSAAVFGKNAARQARKAQDLRVAGNSISAEQTELSLRRMGKLLGNEQNRMSCLGAESAKQTVGIRLTVGIQQDMQHGVHLFPIHHTINSTE